MIATTSALHDYPQSVASVALGIVVSIYYLRHTTSSRHLRIPKSRRTRYPRTTRQSRSFLAGIALTVVLTTYPIETLSRVDSTTLYILDNLLLMLGAVPLLLIGIPKPLISKITKPKVVDRTLTVATKYLPATIIFSGSWLLSMFTPIVDAQAHNAAIRGGMQFELFLGATLMWTAALRLLPGVRHLSTAARIAFLFTQSLLPSFPAFVLIFANRPLYPVFAHHVSILGLSAVGDQELAGGLSKLLSIAILWGVSVAILLKANQSEELGDDPEPITWDDVERELDRTTKRAPHQS